MSDTLTDTQHNVMLVLSVLFPPALLVTLPIWSYEARHNKAKSTWLIVAWVVTALVMMVIL